MADSLFRNSKRYPSLLRYVVERALSGHGEQLKERSLGIDVFGRDPDYDTNLEPVVRTTAVEIRKRLAAYYSEPGREAELRIDLPAGSYAPEFRRPAAVVPEAPVPLPLAVPVRRRWPSYALAVTVLAVICYGAVRFHPWASPTALDRFWNPVLGTSGSVLLCIGGPQGTGLLPAPRPGSNSPAPASPSELTAWQVLRTERVALSDAMTLSRLTALFQAKAKPYQIRGYAATTFADMRNTPVVLIGAFDNPWTLRLTAQFRYTLVSEQIPGDTGSEFIDWIRDRQNPSRQEWSVNNDLPYLKLTDDYAIVARTIDPNTQHSVVVAAGLLKWGTVAAGEFLTDPKYMEEVARQAPPDWDRKNIEIVIRTKVFNGISGPPTVLAAHFW
ncbi:MAG: hypothetical protein NTW28_34655 [Candidatus Solibacter sp.]|nr:hypothetical protein [Candidatus Solibacter sp.]